MSRRSAVPPPGVVTSALIARVVANAEFADAVSNGELAHGTFATLARRERSASATMAPASEPLLGSLWRGVPIPGTPAASALQRAPRRCDCGGVMGPDGQCAECKRRGHSDAPASGSVLARQQIAEDDERLHDPGFLICTAFCYLGIPPSMFKDIVAGMLEAAYEHFVATDVGTARERFHEYRQELSAYSKIRLLAKAFRFLMTGELGMGIVIRAARATAVRTRVLTALARAGLKTASLAAAEQIVRKVIAVIDAAIAVGCGAFCGVEAWARAILEVTEAVEQGLASALEVIEGIGSGLQNLVSDLFANAYGSLDPANWRISSALPTDARMNVSALGLSLFAQVRPGSPWRRRAPNESEADAFLANMGRPIASFTTPYVQRVLLPAIATSIQGTTRGPSAQRLDGPMLAAMSPAGLVALLRDSGLISFVQDPIDHATAELSAEPEPSGASAP